MNNEIKEINKSMGYIIIGNTKYYNLAPEVIDCIFNLQEEVIDLRESDWAWHQTLKIQNAREYRSKFLKDFQKEYGTNTYPDYDEIYKRYDKMKSRNEKAVEKLYCWGEALDPIFQKEMLNILKGSDKE